MQVGRHGSPLPLLVPIPPGLIANVASDRVTWLDECGMLPTMVTRYLLLGVLLYLYPHTTLCLMLMWTAVCYVRQR